MFHGAQLAASLAHSFRSEFADISGYLAPSRVTTNKFVREIDN